MPTNEQVRAYQDAVWVSRRTRGQLMSAEVRGDSALAEQLQARLRNAKADIEAFRRLVAREKREAREIAMPYVAGVWEQGCERELCVWSRHATEDAAKKAARRYARRMRAEGPLTGGAHSWSGGWRGPAGEPTWINADGEET
jgi:hypothetical protein